MFWGYCWLFVCDFPYQTVPIPPDQNVLIPLDHNVLILFVSNKYIGNIGTFWYRKLCMKTWHNSKPLWILSIFFYVFFGSKLSWYPNIHIIMAQCGVNVM